MATYNYFVTNNGNLSYQFSGISDANPTFTFQRGDTVVFNVVAEGHPLLIKTIAATGTDDTYDDGVTNNGADNGTITFVIPDDAPTVLYYQCQNHTLMNGIINIPIAPTTTTTTTTTTEAPVTTSTTTTSTSTTTTEGPIVVTTTQTPDGGTGPTTTTQPPDYIEPIVTNLTNVAPDYAGGVLIVRSQANNSPWFGGTDSDTNLSILPFIWNLTMEPLSNVESIDVVWNVKGSGNTTTKNFTQFDRNFRTVALTIEGQYAFAPNKTYELKFVWKRSDGSSVTSDSVEFVVLDPSATTTTSTTTTTDSPLDIILDRTGLNECPCGIVSLPAGGTDGLKLIIKDGAEEYHTNFIHTSDVKVENEGKFVTITETIKDNITAKDLAIYIDVEGFSRLTVENVISITVKEYNTKKVIANVLYGTTNAKTKSRRSGLIDKPSIQIAPLSDIDLYDNALIFEIESVCEYGNKPCCDSLPTSIRLFGDDTICLPLEEYFPPDEINPDITTPPPPDDFVFVQNLTAVVDSDTNNVVLSAQVNTVYNNPVMYQFEFLSGECVTRLTTPQIAEPNEIVTFTDTENFGSNSYRLVLTRPNYHEDIEPASAFSNSAYVNNSTTQPPEPPDPEKNTIYTTAPPPATPDFNSLDYNGTSWSLEWDLNQPLSDLTDISIRYRTNDGVNWSTWNSFNYQPTDPEWSSLEDGDGYVPPIATTFTCLTYEFRIRVYKNPTNFSETSSLSYINATNPDAPIGLSVNRSQTVNTDYEVSWNPPANDGGCSTLYYTVEYREYGSAVWVVATDPPITATSLTISNLSPTSEYYARVKTVNVFGMGSEYSADDPNALVMLTMEDVNQIDISYTGANNPAYHTVDISSYGRIVKVNTGYVDTPITPSTYMVSDEYANGSKSFYTKPHNVTGYINEPSDPVVATPACPAAQNIWRPNIQFSSYIVETCNNLHFRNDQFGNSTLQINDGTKSKYTIDFWMKLPSVDAQITGNIECFTFWGEYPTGGTFLLELELNFLNQDATAFNFNLNNSRYFGNDPYRYELLSQANTLSTISDTDWHHYAWVMDGDLNNSLDNKYVRFYVDGELVFNRSYQFTNKLNGIPEITEYWDTPAIIDWFCIGEQYTGSVNPTAGHNTQVPCMYVDQFRISQIANFDGTLIKDAVTPTTAFSEYAEIELPDMPLGSTGYRFKFDGYEDSSAGAFSDVLLYMNDPLETVSYFNESPLSIYFDGTADLIDINHDDSLNLPVAEVGQSKAYTVDFWAYMFGGNVPAGGMIMLDENDFKITLSGSSGLGWGFTVKAYGVDAIVTLPSNPFDRFSKDEWNHHAIEIKNIQTGTGGNNSFDVTYYINGEIVNTSGTKQYPNTHTPPIEKMRIGATYGGFATYEGYLSHIRITQGARYNGAFTAPSSMGEYYKSQDPMWDDVVLLLTGKGEYENSKIITDDSKFKQDIVPTAEFSANNVLWSATYSQAVGVGPPLAIPNNPDGVGFYANYFEAANKVSIYNRNGNGIPNSPPTYVTIQAIDSERNILGMPSEPIKIVLDEDV